MTEDEAKTQDCIGPPNCGYAWSQWNEGLNMHVERRLCKGSACKMAWRWRKNGSALTGLRSQTEGYCGLAGEP